MNPPTNLVATAIPCEDLAEEPPIARMEVAYDPPTDEFERELISAQVGASYTGTSTVLNVIVGKGYFWARGANETSITYALGPDHFEVIDSANATQYFLPTTNTVTIAHSNNAAVSATLHELRVQTYRVYRDGVAVHDGVGTKQEIADHVIAENTFASYAIEAIAANGDRGKSATVVALTPSCATPSWPVTFGSATTENTQFYQMRQDASGNLLVVGELLGGVVVIKFNSSGGLEWYKWFKSTINLTPWAVALKTNGNIVIGCSFNGTVNFGGSDLIANPPNPQRGAKAQSCLFELSSLGVHQWSMALVPAARGTPVSGSSSLDTEYVQSIAVDGSGNIYVGGYDVAVGGQFGFTYYGWIESYNSSQVLRWHRNILSTAGAPPTPRVVMNGAQLWVLGSLPPGTTSVGCADYTPVANPLGSASTDFYISKVNSSTGECQSATQYGSGDIEALGPVLPLADGGLLVSVSITSFWGPPNVGGPPITGTSRSAAAFVLVRYDSTGAFVWQSPYRGASAGGLMSFSFNGNNIVVTGTYSAQLTWGGANYPGSGITPQDGFVARMTLSDGAQIPSSPIVFHTSPYVFASAIDATYFYYLYQVEVAGRGADIRIERVALP